MLSKYAWHVSLALVMTGAGCVLGGCCGLITGGICCCGGGGASGGKQSPFTPMSGTDGYSHVSVGLITPASQSNATVIFRTSSFTLSSNVPRFVTHPPVGVCTYS